MNSENDRITVSIVAASPIARAGLETVLKTDDDIVVAASAAEISAALADFSIGKLFDVLLVNIERKKDFDNLFEFFDGNDSEEIYFPFVIALLPFELQISEHIIRLLQSGARGILPQDASASELSATVRAVTQNLTVLSPEFIETSLTVADATILSASDGEIIFSDERIIEALTAREAEVLELIVEGESNKRIAVRLKISEHTVKFHVASIFGKLGVNTRTEAVTQALRRGLIML